jgi:hypothetical protein
MASLLLPAPVPAAGPAWVRDLISRPVRLVDVLGRFATALYLRLAGGEVIALLSSDAVRLPIGLILPTSSREFPLTCLSGPVVVGSGVVQIRSWSCRVSRLVSLRASAALTPDRRACEHVRRRLADCQSADPDLRLPDALPDDALPPEVAADLVRRLLGVGPGLTPAGDDVLAGLLVGLWSFGQRAEPLRLTVLAGLAGVDPPSEPTAAGDVRERVAGSARPRNGRPHPRRTHLGCRVGNRCVGRRHHGDRRPSSGNLVEAVTTLTNEPGETQIAMSGSVFVVRQLLAAGLVDVLHLLVHPVALRRGMRLFDEGESPIRCGCSPPRPFSTGVLHLIYAAAETNR